MHICRKHTSTAILIRLQIETLVIAYATVPISVGSGVHCSGRRTSTAGMQARIVEGGAGVTIVPVTEPVKVLTGVADPTRVTGSGRLLPSALARNSPKA
jgi:hypothetical protein